MYRMINYVIDRVLNDVYFVKLRVHYGEFVLCVLYKRSIGVQCKGYMGIH